MIKGVDEEEASSTASADGGKWREANGHQICKLKNHSFILL